MLLQLCCMCYKWAQEGGGGGWEGPTSEATCAAYTPRAAVTLRAVANSREKSPAIGHGESLLCTHGYACCAMRDKQTHPRWHIPMHGSRIQKYSAWGCAPGVSPSMCMGVTSAHACMHTCVVPQRHWLLADVERPEIGHAGGEPSRHHPVPVISHGRTQHVATHRAQHGTDSPILQHIPACRRC